MSSEAIISQSSRQRAYNLNFQKKVGEVFDLAGRALVAAGFGVGIVAELAADRLPHPGIRPVAIAVVGFALIYRGISWQAGADADKEYPDA